YWNKRQGSKQCSSQTGRDRHLGIKAVINPERAETANSPLKNMDVTLDPDTAHPNLILFDHGKQVRYGDIKLELPDNPKRFDYCPCVLAKEGFSSGRFYFEVQVKGMTDWDLGVASEFINRKGIITAIPEAGYWIVVLRNGNNYLAGESSPVPLSLRVKPQVVGVFVDYEEGLVSFYDVESRSHIFSFTSQSFTEKLFPFFSPLCIHSCFLVNSGVCDAFLPTFSSVEKC
uniref:B30.2/SPRY domain-containing protein n=1 Tax=Sinocyclocheilus rhinocerous TaxID=307959 RepID=A0A673MD47_9TELE